MRVAIGVIGVLTIINFYTIFAIYFNTKPQSPESQKIKFNCDTCIHITDNFREVQQTTIDSCKAQFIRVIKGFGGKQRFIDKVTLLNYLNTDVSDYFLQCSVDNDKQKFNIK